MAKISETITLTAVRDIESVSWYYQLKSGTSAPSKPTVSPPPSPWQTSEPSYTAGDTKYLFVVERTVYTDGTFEYTTPTMSSAYEAAKQAYNEAENAKKVATNFMSADSTGIMVADMRSGSSQTPSNPSGRNVLIDNDSVDIRDSKDVLASFGESAVIGKDTGSQAIIDYHSLQMVDASDTPYFVAADMRDESGYALIYQEFEATYQMYDNDDDLEVIISPAIEIVDILDEYGDTVLDNEAKAEIISSGAEINIETVHNNSGKIWTLIYRTTGEAKYYTLGQRSESINKGAFSVAAGYQVEASGYSSMAEGYQTVSGGKGSHAEGIETYARGNGAHAEGINTKALSSGSHAEGNGSTATNGHAEGKGTISMHTGQTVMGWYNEEKYEWDDILALTPKYLLIIGNGKTADARSDAFKVSWKGIPYFRNPNNDFASVFDLIYPIGSIYMSVNSTSPATLFGGTWVQIQDRFLLAAGSSYAAGATGGEATHKLTVAEMPSHTHVQNQHRHSMGAIWSDGTGSDSRYVMESKRGTQTRYTAYSTPTNQNTGGGGAHNNMPPYLAVYVWKRTA